MLKHTVQLTEMYIPRLISVFQPRKEDQL